jgi:hypothetical protein
MKLSQWKELVKISKTGYFENCNYTVSKLDGIQLYATDADVIGCEHFPFRGGNCNIHHCGPIAIEPLDAHKRAMYYRKYGYEKYCMKYIMFPKSTNPFNKRLQRNRYRKSLIAWDYYGEKKK